MLHNKKKHNNKLIYKKYQMTYAIWYFLENRRLELLTPCVQSRCSTNWANPPYEILGFTAPCRCISYFVSFAYFSNWANPPYLYSIFNFARAPCRCVFYICRLCRRAIELIPHIGLPDDWNNPPEAQPY